MKDDGQTTAKRKPGPTRFSAAVERAEKRKQQEAGEVKETRVDIKREGWTTGSDMPLPRACQTATCIHKEHQLTKDTSAELEDKLLADMKEAATRLRESAKLLVCSDECDEHHVYGPDCVANLDPNHWSNWTDKREGGWCTPSSCAVGVCTNSDKHDESCEGPGWGYEYGKNAAWPPLDLPTVSVKRVGMRFWPMLPELSVRILEYGRWFWKRYHVFAFASGAPGQGKQGIPLGVYKSRWEAELQRDRIQQYTREIYTEIKRRVEVGARW
jgi:hypothetical protein